MRNYITTHCRVFFRPSIKLFSKLPFLALCLLLGDCSAETDDRNFCSLSCGGAVIGSSEFKIEPARAAWSLACPLNTVGVQEIAPFTVQFRVYKEVEGVSGGEKKKVPVPNIKITPLVNGILGTTQTHPDLANDSRFTGIKTSPDEWCTDACGLFTMEVVPTCVQESDNEISVIARSGFVSSDAMTITVTHSSAVNQEE